jgi:probable rRNA maturation factor
MTPARTGRLCVAVTDGRGRPHPQGRGLAAWLARHAPSAARGTVSVALIGDARMRTLNRTFRGRDAATDVLSFPAFPERVGRDARRRPARVAPRTPVHLGDLAIALGVAARQARRYGHNLPTELRILALHGVLHLLGYDHERDRGTMQTTEERLRRRAGLPAGLIARTPRALRAGIRSHRR